MKTHLESSFSFSFHWFFYLISSFWKCASCFSNKFSSWRDKRQHGSDKHVLSHCSKLKENSHNLCSLSKDLKNTDTFVWLSLLFCLKVYLTYISVSSLSVCSFRSFEIFPNGWVVSKFYYDKSLLATSKRANFCSLAFPQKHLWAIHIKQIFFFFF